MNCTKTIKRLWLFTQQVVDHDWEVVTVSRRPHIERQIDDELSPPKPDAIRMPYTPCIAGQSDQLVTRVCLRCGLIDDEITAYNTEYRQKALEHQRRQLQAKQLIGKESDATSDTDQD